MNQSFDVVIIGAGIGGLSLAHLLGNYRLRVALVDAKANVGKVTFHTLGSFVDLDQFGLTKDSVAAEETEIVYHSAHTHTKKRGKAYILNKKKLYKELLDKAIQGGVKTFFATRIADMSLDEQGFVASVATEKTDTFSAKIFVDASGATGFFSRRFGLQDKDLNIATGLEYNVKYSGSQSQSHLYVGKLYQGGYGWLFPFGRNRAIIGYGSFDKAVRSELKKRLDKMLEVPFIKEIVIRDNEELNGGTLPITKVKTKFVYKNVVCVGDSVSQVNPLVGEGHRFILEAGLIAAPYIKQAINEGNLDILLNYEKDWNKKFLKEYQRSKLLQIIAGWISKSDLLSDIAALLIATKRNKTFVRLLSGRVRLTDILFP